MMIDLAKCPRVRQIYRIRCNDAVVLVWLVDRVIQKAPDQTHENYTDLMLWGQFLMSYN